MSKKYQLCPPGTGLIIYDINHSSRRLYVLGGIVGILVITGVAAALMMLPWGVQATMIMLIIICFATIIMSLRHHHIYHRKVHQGKILRADVVCIGGGGLTAPLYRVEVLVEGNTLANKLRRQQLRPWLSEWPREAKVGDFITIH